MVVIMATFYGQVKGSSGTNATRVGSKASGITSSVQSHNGSVITHLYDNNGTIKVDISISDCSSFIGNLVFNGTISELKEKLK